MVACLTLNQRGFCGFESHQGHKNNLTFLFDCIYCKKYNQMEKEVTIEYTDLRAGLVKLILQDYCQSILFEQQMSSEKIKEQIEKKLKDLSFKTVVTKVTVNENGSLSGQLLVETEDCSIKSVVFDVYPTGTIQTK